MYERLKNRVALIDIAGFGPSGLSKEPHAGRLRQTSDRQGEIEPDFLGAGNFMML